jgi:hypothetical protein
MLSINDRLLSPIVKTGRRDERRGRAQKAVIAVIAVIAVMAVIAVIEAAVAAVEVQAAEMAAAAAAAAAAATRSRPDGIDTQARVRAATISATVRRRRRDGFEQSY